MREHPPVTTKVGAAVSEMNTVPASSYCTLLCSATGAAFQLSMANYHSRKGSGTRNAKKKQICLSYLSDLISRRSVPVCPVFLSILGRSLLDGARNFTIVPNCMPIGA